MSRGIGVGLIGMGTVGGGVAKLLADSPLAMQRRKNATFDLRTVAVRDASKSRPVGLDGVVLTADAMEVVRDPEVQVVVELTGAPPAYEWIRAALEAGKDVVTANKAVIAEHGEELFHIALDRQVELMFEASVAAGIPIIRSLRTGLVANEVKSLYGILNGTTNYILTRMSRGEGTYGEILADAQQAGYAEPDPTMDVSGMDAAQKLSILSRIAFHTNGTAADFYCEGVESIELGDIEYARELGYTVKLLAIAKRAGAGVEARVHPAMIPSDSLLANIHNEFNAIEIDGSAVGTQVFYGRGAGEMPTSSAVVADLVELAERKQAGAGSAIGDMVVEEGGSFVDISQSELRYYLSLLVQDRPGVLEQIARILSQENISISSVIQKERDLQGGSVPLILLTHEALEKSMRTALQAVDHLDVVEETRFIRMEDL